MKHIFTFFFCFLLSFSLWAQTNVNMGSQATVTNCNYLIYDDGGANGDYSNNANQVMTLYSSDPSNGSVMIEITTLDIDTTDTLYIYDGIGTTGTLLNKINNGNYDNTGTYRYAATIQNAAGALTLQFVSDASGNGGGFAIEVSCTAPCQRINVRFDSLLSSHIPHLDPRDGYYYVDVCPYDTVHLVTYGEYPDNNFSYNQNDATTTFQWDFDLEQIDSLGGHAMDYYFKPGRGYDVAISAVDTHQCVSLIPTTFRVRTSKNPIRDVAHLNPVCTGQQIDLSVGYDQVSSLQLDSVGSEQITSLGVSDTVFFPDGISCPPYGYYYRSYVNFTSFAPNATITSPDDILYVRMKMEHSAIEDIRITFVCPSNNVCRIVPDYQNDGWGGITHYFRTNLGVANRQQEVLSCNAAQNPMGIPWNYVWSNNSTLGYQYANTTYGYCYEPGNVHYTPNPYWDSGSSSYKIDSTDVANMTQVYHPNQSFAGMVGCPLNGNWYIQVQDLWTNDNGYLVEWEMALDPHLLPQNWSYTVAIDTTYLTGPGANGMFVVPDQSGDLQYNVYVVDEFGCVYDTVMPVAVVPSPQPNLGDDISICHGDMVTIESNYDEPNTVYQWNTGDDTKDIMVLSAGEYIVNVATANDSATLVCYGSDTVNVAVNPRPMVDFAMSDTSGCAPLTVRFTDLTTPIADRNSYLWMVLAEDGSLVNSSNVQNPMFEIQDPGIYSVYLRVVNEEGCVDSLIRWNCLHLYLQPVAEFEALPEISMMSESQGIIQFVNYADSVAFQQGTLGLHWHFGDGDEDTATFSPLHTYSSWGDYDVTLTLDGGFGCSSEITHRVVIEDDLVFPNVITPNGDNVNEVFAIRNLNTNINPEDPDAYRSNELTIYDRWGRRVYYAQNYDTVEQDGNLHLGNQQFDAAGLPDGVYYYAFKYKGKARTIEYHGSITVVR